MTKMNEVKKANKLMAVVIAFVMIICTIGFTVAQSSFAEDKGLAASEQVMDDNGAAPSEGVALEASEQVVD